MAGAGRMDREVKTIFSSPRLQQDTVPEQGPPTVTVEMTLDLSVPANNKQPLLPLESSQLQGL